VIANAQLKFCGHRWLLLYENMTSARFYNAESLLNFMSNLDENYKFSILDKKWVNHLDLTPALFLKTSVLRERA